MAAEYQFQFSFERPYQTQDHPRIDTKVDIEITKEGVSFGEPAKQEYADCEYSMVVSSSAHSQQELAAFLESPNNKMDIRDKCRRVDPRCPLPPPPPPEHSTKSSQDTNGTQLDLELSKNTYDSTQGSAGSVV